MNSLAVEKARTLAPSWQSEPAHSRKAMLRRLARLLEANANELADLMADQIGKPVRFGRTEVTRTAEMLSAVASRYDAVLDEEATGLTRLRRRPLGLVAVITPWNNPIYLALGKIAPAVIYGNAVVWKPAPEAASISDRLLRFLELAGWPRGLVSVLNGGYREAECLMNDPSIAAVTITGSIAAGRAARAICAQRGIPLQAELGGNNAAIVWPDADLTLAARQVALGAFELAGQRCTGNRRVIVEKSCRARFLDLLREESSALSWGDPLLIETQIGPMVSALHRDRVALAVERATAGCGPALQPLGLLPPHSADKRRAWYPPTIISCDDSDHEIVQEETFGPVLVVQTASHWDHAVNLCNGVTQGLAAAVFTRSQTIVERFLEEAEAGILKVNQSTADAAVDVPFGGWKASGLGPPEHGQFDVEFYTRPQTVYGTLSMAS